MKIKEAEYSCDLCGLVVTRPYEYIFGLASHSGSKSRFDLCEKCHKLSLNKEQVTSRILGFLQKRNKWV